MKKGFAILSGDVVMERLAAVLAPERAVFVTDVDGILASSPEGGVEHDIIREGTPDDISRVATTVSRADVTGGMEGKLSSVAAIAEMGVETWVVNGLVPGRLGAVISGEDTVGTVVRG